MLKAMAIVILGLLTIGIYMQIITWQSKQVLSGELVREAETNEEKIIIGVISDTHIPTRANAIPAEVFKIFENASYIIHAGDFVELSVAEELKKIAPVVAVQGNMDPISVREKYPKVNTLEVLGWKIGVAHNGVPSLRSSRLKKLAKQNDFDVLIFGHSHKGSVGVEDGVLYINPGSPTQPLLSEASVAVLKVSKGKVEVEIRVICTSRSASPARSQSLPALSASL